MGAFEMKQRGIGVTAYVVCFAVAAVLAALGFFWLNSKNKASFQAASLRNMLQWGIALNLHLVENEDRLPDVGGAQASSDLPQAWYNALPGSIGQESLTQLAPANRPKPGEPSLWMDPGTKEREARRNWSDYFFSFGMNYWLQPDPGQPAWKIYKLEDPSRTVFLTQNAGPRPGVTPETVVYRYGGIGAKAAATVLFCDGHAGVLVKPLLSGASESDTAYTMYWRPFYGAPDPDYEELAIKALPADSGETSEVSP
jgi:prepilin-type processing-associated H-X9-DG protein